MTITDRIYGDIHITDPLIAELIRSKPLQRLKAISQDGATHFILPVWNGNRFEHSVGAWYLAHRFGRPLEEQVACLLHDVPHTAFSHVVDFVMGDDSQEYHDKFLHKIVLGSEIPAICQKHGLDVHKVLRKEDYYLLDNHTPELSFDRWDYFMRDAYMLGILPLASIQQILSAARLRDGQFYFEDLRIAGQLCITSILVCRLGYVNPTSHGSWFLLAEALKVALQEGIITEQDLTTTDDAVWAKLAGSDNQSIHALLKRLQPGNEFIYATPENAEFYGPNKARYVDPLVLQDAELVHVSDVIPGLAAYITEFTASCRNIGVKPA